MFVQQFFVPGLAHSSYLLACAKSCAIIDPRRDVGIYLDAARERGVRITHVLETHLHADFVSGHMDLAAATGAVIVAPKAGKSAFPHQAVAQGDTFRIEGMKLSVLEVPGHTPEHIAYVVTDTVRGDEPVAVFCGDALFVGDVGRPDLFPGLAAKLASQLYDSLHKRLMKLPDGCMVYPAHGAGSLCGRSMGAMRTSTIGYERRFNAALQIRDRRAFIASLTTNMPPAPDHFSRCSAINGKGPTRLDRLPEMLPLAPAAFAAQAGRRTTVVLDIRSYAEFGGLHVPGAVHLDIAGNFATFAGWVLPPGRDILLVASDAGQATLARDWLRRVGLDRVTGYLEGGLVAWAKAGLPTGRVAQWSAEQLQARLGASGGEPLQLVDVRSPHEYGANHIKGAINIPAPQLRTAWTELDPKRPTALICSTGNRSSLGCSLLARQGFRDLYNVAGGMTGYSAAGFSGECPLCITPHGPRFLGGGK
ncbi:MAG: Beta-lactamase hydrolase-like protein [Lentisphaerae bacterium ADurb.BinA184]|nr:MAG: Beta-lactamase hydrolase-like protein [Lentisphaerae bacterium ADurb.BinA184]